MEFRFAVQKQLMAFEKIWTTLANKVDTHFAFYASREQDMRLNN